MKVMKEITVDELKLNIDREEDFQLIDVREEFEYETSNINGENIPLGNVLLETDKISKDKLVVVHCRSGKRSEQAIKLLEDKGFTNLVNLKGGILAWKDAFDPDMIVH
jgi:rhodanese-related sulfurtransferase